MKKICGVMVVLVLAVSLLPGCSCGGGALKNVESQMTATQNQLSSLQSKVSSLTGRVEDLEKGGGAVGFMATYTGIPAPQAGAWALFDVEVDPTVCHLTPVPYWAKYECLGEDTFGWVKCVGFEITAPFKTATMNFSTQWLQFWYDESNVKTNKLVRCVAKAVETPMTANVTPKINPLPEFLWPHYVTPEDYLPNVSYTTGIYTFPPQSPRAGETINCAIFTQEGKQRWISSEIPMGMVQQLGSDGTVEQCLWDYGSSGADRNISREELEGAVPMPPGILPAVCS